MGFSPPLLVRSSSFVEVKYGVFYFSVTLKLIVMNALSSTQGNTFRRYDLDWLRVIAIILVLYFHTAMLFCAEWGWHIKNPETSNLWLEFNYFLSRFRMPLLFFISGVGSFFALRKRSGWQYLKERNHRLIIPLVFAIFVVVPTQIYFERISQGADFTSILDFWPTVFEFVPYPEGGSLSWHHMWFVLYLFVYSAVGLPLFLFLRSEKGKLVVEKLSFFSRRGFIFLLTLPTAFMYTFWTIKFERTNDFIHDLGWLPFWFSYFLIGYLVASQNKLWEAIERDRRMALQLAFLFTIIINFCRWNQLEPHLVWPGEWRNHWISYPYFMLAGTTGWLWLLAILGYGKKYLNRPSKFLSYANEGIYPFYILHQTVIIVLGYYVNQVEESILAKYLFVSTLSLLITVAIYDFCIRPFGVMRYLFGMKAPFRKKGMPEEKKEELGKELVVEVV